jgi:hypothetical protein
MEQSSSLIDYYNLQPQDYNLILSEFNKSIHNNRFLINYDFLMKNCDNIKFDKDRWIMRPEYFCADHYGHPFIYPVILLSNQLKTIFEFTPDKFLNTFIKAPKINIILRIMSIYL